MRTSKWHVAGCKGLQKSQVYSSPTRPHGKHVNLADKHTTTHRTNCHRRQPKLRAYHGWKTSTVEAQQCAVPCRAVANHPVNTHEGTDKQGRFGCQNTRRPEQPPSPRTTAPVPACTSVQILFSMKKQCRLHQIMNRNPCGFASPRPSHAAAQNESVATPDTPENAARALERSGSSWHNHR